MRHDDRSPGAQAGGEVAYERVLPWTGAKSHGGNHDVGDLGIPRDASLDTCAATAFKGEGP